jgi:hypothetical protein
MYKIIFSILVCGIGPLYSVERSDQYAHIIAMARGQQTLITHKQLGYSASENTCTYPDPLFSPDSSSVVFNGVQPGNSTPLYQYHIPTKQLSVLAEVPGRADLKHITPDFKKIIVEYGHYSGIRNREKSSFVYFDGHKPVLSPSEEHIITHINGKIRCYTIDGKFLFECEHALSNHQDGRVTAAFNPEGTLLATTVGTMVTIVNALTGAPLKKIEFPHKVGYLSYPNKDHLLAGVLTKPDYWHDLLLTHIETGEYTSLARKIWTPYIPHSLSKDMQLYIGGQYLVDGHGAPDELYHCGKQETLRNYRGGPRWLGHLLSPDATSIIIGGVDGETQSIYPHRYATHRDITHNATIGDLLNLLVAQRQYLNNQRVDPLIMEQLKGSQSERIKEIVQQRYEKLAESSSGKSVVGWLSCLIQ